MIEDPRKSAIYALRETYGRNPIPFLSAYDVAKHFGISTFYKDFNDENVFGTFVKSELTSLDDIRINVSNSLPKYLQNAMIAHFIGHYFFTLKAFPLLNVAFFLNNKKGNCTTSYGEDYANTFASTLLYDNTKTYSTLTSKILWDGSFRPGQDGATRLALLSTDSDYRPHTKTDQHNGGNRGDDVQIIDHVAAQLLVRGKELLL